MHNFVPSDIVAWTIIMENASVRVLFHRLISMKIKLNTTFNVPCLSGVRSKFMTPTYVHALQNVQRRSNAICLRKHSINFRNILFRDFFRKSHLFISIHLDSVVFGSFLLLLFLRCIISVGFRFCSIYQLQTNYKSHIKQTKNYIHTHTQKQIK